MGVTACLIWPGVLEAYRSDVAEASSADYAGLGFPDDNWANWISLVIDDDGESVVRALGCAALLAYWTEGLPLEQVAWASPAELATASDRLSGLIQNGHESVAGLVALYEDYADRLKPAAELLVEDLGTVRDMALRLGSSGKTRVAFTLAF